MRTPIWMLEFSYPRACPKQSGHMWKYDIIVYAKPETHNFWKDSEFSSCWRAPSSSLPLSPNHAGAAAASSGLSSLRLACYKLSLASAELGMLQRGTIDPVERHQRDPQPRSEEPSSSSPACAGTDASGLWSPRWMRYVLSLASSGSSRGSGN